MQSSELRMILFENIKEGSNKFPRVPTGEEARPQLHTNASNIEQVLAATPHKAPIIRPPTSYHEHYPI